MAFSKKCVPENQKNYIFEFFLNNFFFYLLKIFLFCNYAESMQLLSKKFLFYFTYSHSAWFVRIQNSTSVDEGTMGCSRLDSVKKIKSGKKTGLLYIRSTTNPLLWNRLALGSLVNLIRLHYANTNVQHALATLPTHL